jgi:hypothetical protein
MEDPIARLVASSSPDALCYYQAMKDPPASGKLEKALNQKVQERSPGNRAKAFCPVSLGKEAQTPHYDEPAVRAGSPSENAR